MRPNCKKCQTPLSGHVRYDHTTCPNCGKRWRLNTDHAAIYTVTLEVHDANHEETVPTIGETRNGESNP